MPKKLFPAMLFCALPLMAACTPTVKVEAPDKPIEINMNIKIEQEVRIRVEKDLDKEIAANPDLFGIPSGTK
jgi:hypothetical protein